MPSNWNAMRMAILQNIVNDKPFRRSSMLAEMRAYDLITYKDRQWRPTALAGRFVVEGPCVLQSDLPKGFKNPEPGLATAAARVSNEPYLLAKLVVDG